MVEREDNCGQVLTSFQDSSLPPPNNAAVRTNHRKRSSLSLSLTGSVLLFLELAVIFDTCTVTRCYSSPYSITGMKRHSCIIISLCN